MPPAKEKHRGLIDKTERIWYYMNFKMHMQKIYKNLEMERIEKDKTGETRTSFYDGYSDEYSECLERDRKKLLQHIYYDMYYEKQFELSIQRSDDCKSNHALLENDFAYREYFENSYCLLTKHWNKLEEPSSEPPYFLWEIFLVIYEAYPQLCSDNFPVVLFLLTDSYYEFCRYCYKYKNSQVLPQKPNDEQKEKILSFFEELLSGENVPYYLSSLVDAKGGSYSESSLHEGKRIYEKINTKIQSGHLPKTAEAVSDELKKEYQFRIRQKNEKRAIANKEKIYPGENFQALMNFIWDIKHTSYFNNDIPSCMYAVYHMTGWLPILASIKTYEIDMESIKNLFFLPLPSTLSYLYDYLFPSYTDLLINNRSDVSDPKRETLFKNKTYTLLEDLIAFYIYMQDENHKDNFNSWYQSASEQDIDELKSEIQEEYENIDDHLRDSKYLLNIDDLCLFLSYTCFDQQSEDTDE